MENVQKYDDAEVKAALTKCEQSITEERKGDHRKAYELLQEAVDVFKTQLELAPKSK